MQFAKIHRRSANNRTQPPVRQIAAGPSTRPSATCDEKSWFPLRHVSRPNHRAVRGKRQAQFICPAPAPSRKRKSPALQRGFLSLGTRWIVKSTAQLDCSTCAACNCNAAQIREAYFSSAPSSEGNSVEALSIAAITSSGLATRPILASGPSFFHIFAHCATNCLRPGTASRCDFLT